MQNPKSLTILFYHSFLFFILMSILLSSCAFIPSEVPSPTATIKIPDTPIPSDTPTITTYQTKAPLSGTPSLFQEDMGVFFLSIADHGFFHLFVFNPLSMPLSRLTNGSWDDETPALEPEGRLLAFSSNRNNYWDLYILDFSSGQISNITNSPEFDANPSWSPDGAYIAYASYQQKNFDIFIKSILDPSGVPIQLTNDPAMDTSPAWSPRGRQIAFISDRTGNLDVWIADLNEAGNQKNISNTFGVNESYPSWSPNGRYLAWSSIDPTTGYNSVVLWDSELNATSSKPLFPGTKPVWMGNNEIAILDTYSNQSLCIGYSLDGTIVLPSTPFTEEINGISYGSINPDSLVNIIPVEGNSGNITFEASSSHQYLEKNLLVVLDKPNEDDFQLVKPAFGPYTALRQRVRDSIGWDAIGFLENAFIPLSTPSDPAIEENWLLTGRAIALDPALIQSNLAVVLKEQFGQEIYWRIFLKTKSQDGSQGKPLNNFPWDFSSRARDSISFENGGSFLKDIPDGYWLDLTSLAFQFGWTRLPALSTWRTYYPGSNFNMLVFQEGLDWSTAMLQLYPSEILLTPTRVIPPTRTPTRTPLWYRTPTPTFIPTLIPTKTI